MLRVTHAGPRIDVGPGKKVGGDQKAQSASILYLYVFICNHQQFANSSRIPDVRCSSVIKTKIHVITRERFGVFFLPQKPTRYKSLPTPTPFLDMVDSAMGDEATSADAESRRPPVLRSGWECALERLTW